jgi:hypothetical protein
LIAEPSLLLQVDSVLHLDFHIVVIETKLLHRKETTLGARHRAQGLAFVYGNRKLGKTLPQNYGRNTNPVTEGQDDSLS